MYCALLLCRLLEFYSDSFITMAAAFALFDLSRLNPKPVLLTTQARRLGVDQHLDEAPRCASCYLMYAFP